MGKLIDEIGGVESGGIEGIGAGAEQDGLDDFGNDGDEEDEEKADEEIDMVCCDCRNASALLERLQQTATLRGVEGVADDVDAALAGEIEKVGRRLWNGVENSLVIFREIGHADFACGKYTVDAAIATCLVAFVLLGPVESRKSQSSRRLPLL